MSQHLQPLPWRTEPSTLGSNLCTWCHRDIHLPALPCSTEPVEGLLRMNTRAGQGHRCKYELSTRVPELLSEPLGL